MITQTPEELYNRCPHEACRQTPFKNEKCETCIKFIIWLDAEDENKTVTIEGDAWTLSFML